MTGVVHYLFTRINRRAVPSLAPAPDSRDPGDSNGAPDYGRFPVDRDQCVPTNITEGVMEL